MGFTMEEVGLGRGLKEEARGSEYWEWRGGAVGCGDPMGHVLGSRARSWQLPRRASLSPAGTGRAGRRDGQQQRQGVSWGKRGVFHWRRWWVWGLPAPA